MIEETILSGLINNEEYTRKVINFIKRDYFKKVGEKVIFTLIHKHFLQYNTLPTKSSLEIDLNNRNNISEAIYNESIKLLHSLEKEEFDVNWLVDATEDFCKKRAFYNALLFSSDLISKDDPSLYHEALNKVTEAISVTFDNSLGSDYFNDAEKRFDSYTKGSEQVPCSINSFNTVTKGGFVKPSLTVFIAPTGVGKSLFLCNFAQSFISEGKNVLYFTFEMSEVQVEQRVDLNVLDMTVEDIKYLTKSQYFNRIVGIKKKNYGRLITKFYPAFSAHMGHFRHFIDELKQKQNFIPDVIIFDYLVICGSSKLSRNAGSYEYFSIVAAELRGIGQEYNCPVFTAAQTNREGTKQEDYDITDIAESWGIVHHSDYVYGIIETEQLRTMSMMKVKRFKDRYNDYTSWMPNFNVGVDKTKQKIYDLDTKVEDSINNNMVEKEFSNVMGFK